MPRLETSMKPREIFHLTLRAESGDSRPAANTWLHFPSAIEGGFLATVRASRGADGGDTLVPSSPTFTRVASIRPGLAPRATRPIVGTTATNGRFLVASHPNHARRPREPPPIVISPSRHASTTRATSIRLGQEPVPKLSGPQ